MDPVAIATAAVGLQAGQFQTQMAVQVMKMQSEQGANAVAMLNTAQENAQRLMNVAAGVGQAVDITA